MGSSPDRPTLRLPARRLHMPAIRAAVGLASPPAQTAVPDEASGRDRRRLWVWGSSTDEAPGRCSAAVRDRDHGDQRTSQGPGFGQRAQFEHRNVHMRPTKDLVDRMCAGQGPATGAPPGTRTPNPRIKSPNLAVPARSAACWPVSFAQVGAGYRCRRVSVGVGCFRGHRAPMEHRDRQPVLDRRWRRGSGDGVEAADFRSAGRGPCAAVAAIDGLRTGEAEHVRLQKTPVNRPGTTSDFGTRYLLRASRRGVQAGGSGMTHGSCLRDRRGGVTGTAGRS